MIGESTSRWMPSSASCPVRETCLRPTGRAPGRPSRTWTDRLPSGRSRTPWRRSGARSPEAHQFIRDAFGYDSGFNPHNAGDAIQYLIGGNNPSTEARVPIEGVDRIPRALAARFGSGAGSSRSGRTFGGSRWTTVSCGSSSLTEARSRRADSCWRSRCQPSRHWSIRPPSSTAPRGGTCFDRRCCAPDPNSATPSTSPRGPSAPATSPSGLLLAWHGRLAALSAAIHSEAICQ